MMARRTSVQLQFLLILLVFLSFCPSLIAASAARSGARSASRRNPKLDFDKCGAWVKRGLNNYQDDYVRFIWQGPVDEFRGPVNRLLFITYEGCVYHCGDGYMQYSWTKISGTITTWVLPLAGGLLLQAPYESNEMFSTILVICRWLGSPMASLAYTLWNIRVTGRCASRLRTVFAQRTTPGFPHRAPQHLLQRGWNRFSNECCGTTELDEPRGWDTVIEGRIAPGRDRDDAMSFAELRDSFYILCVLNQYGLIHADRSDATKILIRHALFSKDQIDPALIGERRALAAKIRRERKHGVVQVFVAMMWFLIALIISIYNAFEHLGENATAHDLGFGLLMSWFPVLISCTLVDRNPTNSGHTKAALQAFLEAFLPTFNSQRPPTQQIENANLTQYCGQGRVKWHYGAANSIIDDIDACLRATQTSLLVAYGDGTLLTAGEQSTRLWRFDRREVFQVIIAGVIVGLSAIGAAVISYHTPTVGLGCRAGGYLVFICIAFGALLLEFIIGWGVVRPNNSYTRGFFLMCLRIVLTVMEIVNAAWLVYIISAQTFGTYNSCWCKSSQWGSKGGYMDFLKERDYKEMFDIERAWIGAAVTGSLPLFAIIYTVHQWCTQSFLWTEDYDKAMAGLRHRFFFTRWLPFTRRLPWDRRCGLC